MHFDKDFLSRLTRLCKIECTEDELNRLLISLESILSHVDQLEEIDTKGVTTCIHVNEIQTLSLGDDEERDIMPHQRLMKNAPDAIGGMVKVPPIINA
ncbi:MAG: Asp-tRNA(Asn)/Glu-tRNA(Gln) amidotransferase subunit GatC [Simkaniaceae bacterium]|nr:Asp-tRNA(Asn)/Glu-tRNA(Gln) amidotransferase subunit GatC [Simkaniaceae bacterium]